ncbi:MAG: hypothetical protein E6J47_02520 [Chloroflexi bacterium]|nr:MAG: hypothetical protein E6J47_02520 [Chloroflexota bacterium]
MRYNWHMHRYLRLIVPVMALVLLVAGITFADRGKSGEHPSHQPKAETDSENSSEAISDQLLDRIVASLADQGISTDADAVRGLAEKYGVGGAVRVLVWADASGKDPSEIGDMFDSGMGWGEIAHKLMEADASLDLSPGIGKIMSNGHAHGGGAGGSHTSDTADKADEDQPGD